MGFNLSKIKLNESRRVIFNVLKVMSLRVDSIHARTVFRGPNLGANKGKVKLTALQKLGTCSYWNQLLEPTVIKKCIKIMLKDFCSTFFW